MEENEMERTKKRIPSTPVRNSLIRHVLMINKQWNKELVCQMTNKNLLANCSPLYRDVFEDDLKNELKQLKNDDGKPIIAEKKAD